MKFLTKWKALELPSGRSTFPYKKSEFDGHAYLRANQDVAQSGADPWMHFVNHGHDEGRKFTSFADTAATYIKIIHSGYFDPHWYLTEYPNAIGRDCFPLKHFCDHGVWEGRDPGPHFSTSWYWEQYPDIRGMNPLLHYIEHGIQEGRMACPPKGALNTLQRAYEGIRDLDSELSANPKFSQWKSVPITDGRLNNSNVKSVMRSLLSEFGAATKRLVLVPWCIHSGSDIVVANILRAANEICGPDSTVLVIIDQDKIEGKDWLLKNQRVVNFAAFTSKLSEAEKRLVLEKMILAISPDACLNVNSYISWEVFKSRGGVLSAYTKLYACMFCADYNEYNIPAGYAHTHFRDAIPYLSGVISDNARFPQELTREFSLLPKDAAKFSVVHQPLRTKIRDDRKGKLFIHDKCLNILWAGRISRQKNYKLVAEIIDCSPSNFHFNVYGWGDETSVREFNKLVEGKKNVTVHGAYNGFESLPLDAFDVYLYTSLWDGMPNALLEGAAYGFPLVASDVGGIREVIQPDRGWLIKEIEKPEKYIEALKEIFENKEAALAKGQCLKQYVASIYTWALFCDALATPGAFLGAKE